MNGFLGDIETNAKNIPRSVLRVFREAQESHLHIESYMSSQSAHQILKEAWHQMSPQVQTYTYAQTHDHHSFMEQKRLDLGFDHYLWAIVSVGSSELPWISTPACLLKEIKNKTLIQFPDDSYAFLCEHIQTLYMAHEPNTDTSRIDVKRIPSSFSNRVQLFDSVLGSRGNQSEPASFILVKFACETTTGTEHAAQVTKYYKIRVVLHKNGMEETKTCLFAHVRWFKEYSYQMDTIGVYVRKYENAFHEEGAYDPWVPVHQISAQFIPFVFEQPRPAGNLLPPKKVMLPCRVDLKTPC